MIERPAVDDPRAKVALHGQRDEAALRSRSGDRGDRIGRRRSSRSRLHNPSRLSVASMFQRLNQRIVIVGIQRVHAGA